MLGSVRVSHVIGEGGMGSVWYGVHKREHTAVAVKVLAEKFAEDRTFQRAFRNEVRAVASLDHPHIVRVYDHGEVSERAAEQSEGVLPAGVPFLVMELVPEGHLGQQAGKLSWSALRRVLLSLLDALAHAHARGVVHRDLKPQNVLLTAGGAVKLSDFGLAHAIEETEAGAPVQAGTPAYMAPEQFDGRWRDYGPWTDLYAVGCVAWAMVMGAPPFGTARSWSTGKFAHQHRPPPPLKAAMTLPDGFEVWLERLMEKNTAYRYRRAADAAADLYALGTTSGGIPRPVLRSADQTLEILPTLGEAITVRRPDMVDTLVFDEQPLTERPDTHLSLAGAIPSTLVAPETWRREQDRPTVRQVAAGIGLYGLRTLPMVDREPERDSLWQVLRAVQRDRRAQAVVLQGASGTGKSRLAQWLAERAHEVGAAVTLRASHSPVPGPGQGLGAMLATLLRCAGLPREAVAARLRVLVGDDDAGPLLDIILPADGGSYFHDSAERFAPITRLLREICTERMGLIWLDDVQWGRDALRFVQWLLDRQGADPLPVLIVATAVDEELAHASDISGRLDAWAARPDVTRIEVGPIPPKHRPALVRALLGMAGELAGRVETRTAGNPLFAVQLVGDWVQRGLLLPGPRGFQLRKGSSVELPADLHTVWSARIERALALASYAEAIGIEIAAILGLEVDDAEWQEACALAGAEATGQVSERLMDQRLIRAAPGGWQFSHGLLREVLVSRARQGGRLHLHHAACASLLLDRRRADTSWPAGLAERAGRHLVGAGEHEAAAAPLLQGARERTRIGDYGTAAALLGQRGDALRAAAVPETDPRWGEGWLVRSEIARLQGDYNGIQTWLDRIDAIVPAEGWEHIAVRSGCLRGELFRVRGTMPAAVVRLRDVEREAEALGDRALVAEIRWQLGEALNSAGEHVDSDRVLRMSLADFEAVGDPGGAAQAHQGLAELAKEQGRHEEALVAFRQVRERHEQAGNRWGVASSTNSEGDVLRYLGRTEEALACYATASRIFEHLGSDSVVFPEYNAALAHLERRDVARARELLDHALVGFVRIGGRAAVGDCHIALAACAAADGQWDRYDDHMAQAVAILAQTGIHDEDTARVAETGGAIALAAGERERASRVYAIARAQWEGLHRGEEAAAIRALLDTP